MPHRHTALKPTAAVVAIIAATVVMLASFIFAGYISFSLQDRLSKDRVWVIHTYQVMSTLSELKAVVEQAILADDDFDINQPNFAKAEHSAHQLVNILIDLMHDNPQQLANAKQAKVELAAEFAVAKAQAPLPVRRRAAEAIMRRLDLMLSIEEDLLTIRSHKLEHRRAQAQTALIILVASAAICLLLSAVFVTRLLWQLARAEFESRRRAIESENARIRLDAVLSSMGEGVYQLNVDGKVDYLNKVGESILGYKLADIAQKNMHELIHYKLPDGSLRPANICPLMQVMRDGVAYEAREDYFVHSDGSFIPVQYSSSPIVTQGKVTGAVVSFRDISERQAVEKRISEFYSTVSHELRTPLTSIRAALGLMEGGAAGMLSERAMKLVKVGNQESQRLVRLINDILDMKKLESGKFELHLSEVSADQLVSDALLNLESAAVEQKVELVFADKMPNLYTPCDRDRVLQVLTNLLGNAIKFSPADSQVTVGIQFKNKMAEFSVSDCGGGIPEEKTAHLFQMFHQVDASDTRSKGGTGLGLAISKAIVEEHGGTIGVRSTVGQGSTFWFTLPAIVKIRRQEEPSPAINAKVLIVEDDTELSEVMSNSLSRDGYIIDKAHSLKDAYAGLEKQPEVIVLDLLLPDGNGLELVEHVSKQVEPEEKAPIIVLTGSNAESKQVAFPVIVDWLKKPFNEVRLKRSLSLALQKKNSHRPVVLIVDDDQTTREFIKHQLNETDVEYIEAIDGAQAIDFARQRNPDLIILDIGLPPPNGFGVVEILRQEKASATPLIVYSAKDLTAEEQERLTLGMTAYLEKTQTTEVEFMQAVRKLLNGLIPYTGTPVTSNRGDHD